MELSIVVQIKNVYGRDVIYPICTKAKSFAKLVNQKTLTQDNLEIIKSLGYSIKIDTPIIKL